MAWAETRQAEREGQISKKHATPERRHPPGCIRTLHAEDLEYHTFASLEFVDQKEADSRRTSIAKTRPSKIVSNVSTTLHYFKAGSDLLLSSRRCLPFKCLQTQNQDWLCQVCSGKSCSSTFRTTVSDFLDT